MITSLVQFISTNVFSDSGTKYNELQMQSDFQGSKLKKKKKELKTISDL